MSITIEGRTIRDEQARREIWVCGPGAFVVMTALAFRGSRREQRRLRSRLLPSKLRAAIDEVAKSVAPLLEDEEAKLVGREWRKGVRQAAISPSMVYRDASNVSPRAPGFAAA